MKLFHHVISLTKTGTFTGTLSGTTAHAVMVILAVFTRDQKPSINFELLRFVHIGASGQEPFSSLDHTRVFRKGVFLKQHTENENVLVQNHCIATQDYLHLNGKLYLINQIVHLASQHL